ncbi:uncharacterized protein MKZ38_004589 [Zalerion maritima]|uniref:Transcription initiation factor TFIID subunit 1 histone acetyltransferase domain-containing protein n=1 Tax=Zalerion maritima TaxID=339359 RepID=A0AAD5RYF0_9PEZI|nr:uncharacterized protein MKZ38_004589 [Zalerion maritima]
MESPTELQNLAFSTMDEDAWRRQEEADDEDMRRALAPTTNLAEIISAKPGDDVQEKADDAIDFEDISDDDLAEEEEPEDYSGPPKSHSPAGNTQVADLTNDEGTSHETLIDLDDDDLFGGPVSEHGGGDDDDDDVAVAPPSPGRDLDFANDGDTLADGTNPMEINQESGDQQVQSLTLDQLREMNFPSNQDEEIPDTFENRDDFLHAMFPSWGRDRHLNWNELFPTKKASMNTRKPTKAPKPLKLTKLSIDIDSDQQNLFRVPGPAEIAPRDRSRELDARGIIPLFSLQSDDDDELIDLGGESDNETVAGFTLPEIEVVCADWDEVIDIATPTLTADKTPSAAESDDEEDWDRMFDEEPPTKKRKTYDTSLPQLHSFDTPTNFDRFEAATARNGRRVLLDLNDRHILIDEADQITQRPKFQPKLKRMANGKLGQDRVVRFNFSNDDAYLALKENHQNKVRATLGNISVEHSLPALKLCWPYYRARIPLEKLFMEDLHRPTVKTRQFAHKVLKWAPRDKKNRKAIKGKKIQEIFKKSNDLTLNDNSTVVMFEYSEQFPPTLSKFGMGNRVINYYRKKSEEDEVKDTKKRDKNDIGEMNVLLPEDRSPFSIFGTVDPGETVPTIHNEMYRAPIFKHDSRNTDFILGRCTTREQGIHHYLRPIEHIYAVGQTFPSTEVPGPHSRKVTTAQKNRMKMIAYRLMRKSDSNTVALGEITYHIKESTDQQNRQKLKEFLSYDKQEKQWGLKKNETLMEEANIRAMIKPEEVCLIDSMHVGLGTMDDEDLRRNLKKKNEEEEEDNQEDDKEESFASKMAPWKTSKAFIDACAGKAMLQLHGEGDPTGHGYGFSFIKTSMKGGYIEAVQGPNATTQDAIERERKANGGHSYNVKKQEQMYNSAIKDIWTKQKSTLSDPTLHDDSDTLQVADEDERFDEAAAATPAVAPTPMGMYDGMSQISRTTGASRTLKDHEKLRIVRKRKNPQTGELEIDEQIIEDPSVAKLYQRRRKQRDAAKIEYGPRDLYALLGSSKLTEVLPTVSTQLSLPEIPTMTGPKLNCMLALVAVFAMLASSWWWQDMVLRMMLANHLPFIWRNRIEQELSRLYKNQERRHVREKQKGVSLPSQNGATPSVEGGGKGTGTTRKCANCGQVGHIKTNKKYVCALCKNTPTRMDIDTGDEEDSEEEESQSGSVNFAESSSGWRLDPVARHTAPPTGAAILSKKRKFNPEEPNGAGPNALQPPKKKRVPYKKKYPANPPGAAA